MAARTRLRVVTRREGQAAQLVRSAIRLEIREPPWAGWKKAAVLTAACALQVLLAFDPSLPPLVHAEPAPN